MLRFDAVTRDAAPAARREQAATLHAWVQRIGPPRADGQADESALRSDNLISGMIDATTPEPGADT